MIDEKRFKDTFNQVHASEELLTEVLNMTTQTKNKSRKPMRITRTLLIAAVLICALALTVAAADAITKRYKDDTTTVIDAFFGNSGNYAEGGGIVEYDEYGKLAVNLPAWSREPLDLDTAERLIAPYLYTLENNTIVKDGFTYTIHAVLYDSNTKTYMARWSVENPDGLGIYNIGINGEFCTTEGSDIYAVCGGREYLDTVHSTDTKLYISSFGVDWEDAKDNLWCEFGRWYDWDEGKMKAWNDTQRIALPREDYGGMPALHFDNGRIIVSPVAIRIENSHIDSLKECTIQFRDGSTYTVFSEEAFIQNTTYGLGSTKFGAFTFNRIVDVDTVSAVIVNGETYPVA